MAEGVDVFGGIALDGDEVGFEPRGDGADLVLQTERLGGAGGRGDDGRHRILAPLLHPIDQLLEVAAVRAGHGVGAEDDLQPGCSGRRRAGPARWRRADPAAAVLSHWMCEKPLVSNIEEMLCYEKFPELGLILRFTWFPEWLKHVPSRSTIPWHSFATTSI
jgi:hypothetical protein